MAKVTAVTRHPEIKAAWSLTAENEETTSKKILLKFMGHTSAHGIGNIAHSKTILWKIFWTFVCLGALGMFIYQVYCLFLLYLSRPISTSVQIIFDKVRIKYSVSVIQNMKLNNTEDE